MSQLPLKLWIMDHYSGLVILVSEVLQNTNCGCGFIKLDNNRIFVDSDELLLEITVVELDLLCVAKACFMMDVLLKISFSFALWILFLGDRFRFYDMKLFMSI